MYFKHQLSFCLLFSLIGISNAQVDSTERLFKISSVSIGGGVLTNQNPPISQDDYKKIAPNNSLVNADLTGFKNNLNGLNIGGYFTMNVGFKKLHKKDYVYSFRVEHRIGIRFLSETILSSPYSLMDLKYYDSLKIGSTMHHNVSIDTTKNYSYDITNSIFMFDLGSIYQSDPRRLFTAYVGYNIGLGTSLSSYATAYYHSNVVIRTSTIHDEKDVDSKFEETSLRNSFVMNGSVLWGANIRFSKRKKFWNKTSMNLEGRFGANSQNVPNYKNFTRITISAHLSFRFLL